MRCLRNEVKEEVHVEAAHVDLGGPGGDGGVHQNGHAIAVEEGEVNQKDVVFGGGRGLAGTVEGLFKVAGEVEVGEHHALGEAGGAAGRGQGGEVFFRIDGDGRGRGFGFGDELVKVQGVGGVGADVDDGFQAREVGAGGFDYRENELMRDEHLHAGVVQLVGQLPGAVGGVDGGYGGARFQDAKIGGDELGAVGDE